MSLSDCALCRAIGETCMDCEPDFDLPPQSGHAVPQWLRDQFSAIEDEAMRMGGCAVFTQMRTKVQAYFEMLRADLSYAVVLAERDQLKAENEDGLAVIRTQKQRLECYIKDAERYQWLEKNVKDKAIGISNEYATDWRRRYTLPLLLSQSAVCAPIALSEAIDDAMAQETAQ